MSKIVVFDSGLGSLSIIKPIQQISKLEIIYFADQKNFPYGKKSKNQLKRIIEHRIQMINKKFDPEIIVIGSNTPTLLFQNLIKKNIIGVTPPLKEAEKISLTKNNAIRLITIVGAIKPNTAPITFILKKTTKTIDTKSTKIF